MIDGIKCCSTSKAIRSDSLKLSISRCRSSSIQSRADSVEWCFLYADWKWLRLIEAVRWERKRLSTRRSDILEIEFRFEIGLKFAGSNVERLGFLRRGVIWESLKLSGKTPEDKERFARWVMIGVKIWEQDLMREGRTVKCVGRQRQSMN